MTEQESPTVGPQPAAGPEEILSLADRIGREVLAPRAWAMDGSTEPPRENFAALGQAGLLGLTIPRRFGGLEADALLTFRVLETLARYCAVTPFVLAQHTGTCGSIAAGGSALAPEVLPSLARGALLVGIGASQLRRAGAPMLRAERVKGGYRLDGAVPWASGFGLMTHIVLGAELADAGPLFLWTPFHEADGIRIGQPWDLTVMRASTTVGITCEGLFVPEERLIGDDRGGIWRSQHGGTLTNPVAFLLGIGAACLDGLRAASGKSGRVVQQDHVEELADEFEREHDRYHGLLSRMISGEKGDQLLDALLAGRVAISALVMRLAQVAIAAEGGSAHLRGNVAAATCVKPPSS